MAVHSVKYHEKQNRHLTIEGLKEKLMRLRKESHDEKLYQDSHGYEDWDVIVGIGNEIVAVQRLIGLGSSKVKK